MPVTFRPTIPSDLSAVIGEPLPYRIKAITVVDGDKILGIGGLGFPPGGPVTAFVQQAPEAKNYPLSFHRAGLMAMQMIREAGIFEVMATADENNPTAVRWLKRLGFELAERQDIPGKAKFWYVRDARES